MVAVVTGNGLGLFNASSNTLGALGLMGGLMGQGRLGQAGGQAYVNAANGNLVLQGLDERLSGRGMDLAMHRTYNSQGLLSDDVDGDGWRWNGESTVKFSGAATQRNSSGTVTRTDAEGHAAVFQWVSEAVGYSSTEGDGAHDTIRYDSASNQWVWTEGSSRLEQRYANSISNSVGRLAAQSDSSGNKITFNYDGAGRLTEVLDFSSGQKIALVYSSTTPVKLSRVDTYQLNTDSSGRVIEPPVVSGTPVKQVEYFYSNSLLSEVRAVLKPGDVASQYFITKYSYESASNRVSSIQQGVLVGQAFTASYQVDLTHEQVGTSGVYRVKTVLDAGGKQTFIYKSVNGLTSTDIEISDAAGNNKQTWSYTYDAAGQLTKVESPAPAAGAARLVSTFEYDATLGRVGDVTRVLDARGNAVNYQYDAQGNRTREYDALGNTISRTYDSKNQLLTQTRYRSPDTNLGDAVLPTDAMTTRYVYDGQSRLRFVISPEGRVSESRYGGNGLLERSLQYTDDRYSAVNFAEQDLAAWAAGLLDKKLVQLTQFAYDFRGNLAKQTAFASVDTSGNGVLNDAATTLTEYVYDGHGALLKQIAVRGSGRNVRSEVTVLSYDGIGREISRSDANGTRSTSYNDSNHTVQVLTQAGEAVVSSYDIRGRLTSASRSAAGESSRETKYCYDAQGRQVLVQDALGNRRFSFYDGAGRLNFTVDAAGAVCRYLYNENGQLSSQTHYARQITAAVMSGWVDNASNPTKVIKATLMVASAAGPGVDLVTTPAQDRRVLFDYDAAGRLTTRTDPADTVTTTSYDGDSRITKQQIGERITQYFYDQDGRRVGVLDPLGYLTETKYDAAGRLTETIRYRDRSPAVANVAAPQWIGLADQNASADRRFEYHLAAIDADGDRLDFSKVGSWPTWLVLEKNETGITVSGMPPVAAVGTTVSVEVQATDGRGKTKNAILNIAVKNSAPRWVNLPDLKVASDATSFSTVLPAATDLETPASGLIYSLPTGLPSWLEFVASSRTLRQKAGMALVPGSYVLTVRVTDNTSGQVLSTERSFVLQVTNKGPLWPAVSNQVVVRTTAVSFTVPQASDPDSTGLLTYSVLKKPDWLLFDASTRTFSGMVPAGIEQGYREIKVAVSDGFESTPLSFFVEVRNAAPLWMTNPVSLSLPSVVPVTVATRAQDPEGGPLQYSAAGLPHGLQVNADGSISGTSIAVGNFAVTLYARDEGGAVAANSFTLTMLNAPPVYNGGLPGGFHIYAGEDAAAFYIGNAFSDPNGDILTYSFSPNADLSIAPPYPTLLIYPDDAIEGQTPIQRNYTVTVQDDYGASKSVTMSYYVNPARPPRKNSATSAATGVPPVAPGAATQLAIAPTVDVLAGLRPSSTEAVHSYRYYDGQGRLAGSVDERGFLSETVYDEQVNTQRSVRYLKKGLTVSATDTLSGLRIRATTGADGPSESSTIAFDDFGRISTSTAVDGTVSKREYDTAGRLVREFQAFGTTEQRATRTRYNAFNEVTGALGGVGAAWLAADQSRTLDQALARFGLRYQYDQLGRMSKLTDANGHDTLSFYDNEDRLTHTVNAKGEVSETLYNAFGQVSSTRRYNTVLSAAQLAALSGGANSSLPILTIDASQDRTSSISYERRGLVESLTDAEGFKTTQNYTRYGELQEQVRTILQAAGAAAAVTTTTRFDYDLAGQRLSQTEDVGGLNFNTQVAYDAYGRVIRSIDAAGKVTRTDYLDGGRNIEVTDPLARVVRSEYDAFGRLYKVFDAVQMARPNAERRATTYAYDDVQRSLIVTTHEGLQLTTLKNRFGETLSVRDARQNTVSYEYDQDGHLTKSTDALQQAIVRNTYDESGRWKTTTDARGTLTRFTYDELNRVVTREVDPPQAADPPGTVRLNLITQYGFDARGDRVTVREGVDLTDPANPKALRTTTYRYDRNVQLLEVVVDPLVEKLTTHYQYDGLGRTLQVAQGTERTPNQQVTQYVFDQLGRRIKEIAAPSAIFGAGSATIRDLTTEYRYDAAGRVSRRIDANGQSTWFVYDAAGQLTRTINALGEVSENTYDANGHVVQVRRYATRIAVSARGDVASTEPPLGTANDQRSYFVYDSDGRQRYIVQAQGLRSWAIAESRYDANGNLIETRSYDRLFDQRYDPSDEGKPVAERRANPIDITRDSLTLDVVSAEVTALGYDETDAKLVNVRRTRFAYDANNRLRFTVDALNGVTEKVYDAAGNSIAVIRYAKPPALLAADYNESGLNGKVDRKDAANRKSYFSYDAASRLRFTAHVFTSDAGGNGTQHMVSEQNYDAAGRVVFSRAYQQLFGALGDYALSKFTDEAASKAQPSDDRRNVFAYDAAGRQVYSARVLVGADGKVRHVVNQQVYDAMGRVLQSIAYATPMPLSDYSKSTFRSLVSHHLSPQDRKTNFVYDVVGRQRFVVAADGSFSETLYDALGQVSERRQFDVLVSASAPRDRDGFLTEGYLVDRRAGREVGDGVTRGEKYTYDAAGRLTTTTDAAGYSEQYAYDALGSRSEFIDKNGSAEINRHRNDPVPFDAKRLTWAYTYDRLGRQLDSISPQAEFLVGTETVPPASLRRVITRNSYDAFGNLSQRLEGLIKDESKPPAEQLISTEARLTRYDYDRLNRAIAVTLPGYYDTANGKVVASASATTFLRTLENFYDGLGNAVRTRLRTGAGSSDFQYEYKAYDTLGRVSYDVDALSNVTGFAYNNFGDQEAVTRYDAAVGVPAGGVDGQWTRGVLAIALAADTKARTIKTSYDTLGRKLTVTQPALSVVLPGATAVSYYAGSTAAVPNAVALPAITARAPLTKYEYTVFGELQRESVQIDDLNGGHWRDTWHYYDARGREIRSIDAAGFHTARSFDALGNVYETIEYALAGPAGIGQLVPPGAPEPSDDDRITAYRYDARNLQTEVVRAGLRYVSLQPDHGYADIIIPRFASTTVKTTVYDSMGQVASSTDALGGATTTQYDAIGRIKQLAEPGRLIAGAGVDPFLSQRLASPVTTFAYNVFGQIVVQVRDSGTGRASDLRTTRQGYDVAGNLISTTDANGNTKNRQVDYAGRLIKETQVIDATLTPVPGFLWQRVQHTLERRYSYDVRGRQTAVLDVYTDSAGMLMQSGQRSVFNAFSEVQEEQRVWGAATATTLSSAKVASYRFDQAGHVFSKQSGDGETRYFYNLAGQVTRQEQRGDNAAGTIARITETGYSARGEAIIQRLPAFSAAFENVFDRMDLRGVLPITEQSYDRWGNVVSRSQGGCVDLQSGAFNAAGRSTTKYRYDHDNHVIAEIAAAAPVVRSDGSLYYAAVTHQSSYDVLGRAVQEREWADDVTTTADEAMQLRRRRKEYDGAGQLTAVIDSTVSGVVPNGIRTEYAYDGHGNRVGTRNQLGIVFIDTFDNNGNVISHGVLRLTNANDSPRYISGSGQTPVLRILSVYQYDQANRRVGSGDNMDATRATIYWSLTKFDERNLAVAQRNASAVLTLAEYDELGNKTREQRGDATLGNIQQWDYSKFNDYSVGQLVKATIGSNVTRYFYNGVGQVWQEDFGSTNNRFYYYHDNGLLKSTTEQLSKGTPGAYGGADYIQTIDVTQYDYTVKGELAMERFNRTGEQDVVQVERGTFQRLFVQTLLDPITRTTFTHYDPLGRVTRVWAPPGANLNNTHAFATLDYGYDELGNVRCTIGPSVNSWFMYDAEGRMTLADGVVRDGQFVAGVGTKISYDQLGRRWQTESFKRDNGSWYDTRSMADPDKERYGWTEYRLEDYEYDDLDHIEFTYQKIDCRDAYIEKINQPGKPRRAGTHNGETSWQRQESRVSNVRGELTHKYVWNSLEIQDNHRELQHWGDTVLQFVTDSIYGGDGRLLDQITTKQGDQDYREQLSAFDRDSDGMLKSYQYSNGVGNKRYVDTFLYSYGIELGGRKEQTITVSRIANSGATPGVQPGNTSNVYDARGRLSKTVISNAQKSTTRSFAYDGQGRISLTQETLSVPGSLRTGSQSQFYAAGRQVGTIGTGTLAGEHFNFAYTPITETASNPSNYTVRANDTLASIAREVYGDSALWYLIADANSIALSPGDPLPSTELGKTYRVPATVSSHNNAGTFKPYNPADIIGNNTPIPALPIPPQQCTGAGAVIAKVLVTAITMLVSQVVTGVTSPFIGPVFGRGLGAAAGDLAGQATGWGLGLQDGIDFERVAKAALAGASAGFVSGRVLPESGVSLTDRLADRALTTAASQLTRDLSDGSLDYNIGSFFELGTEVAAAGIGRSLDISNTYFKLGTAAGRLLNSSLNPQTGWLFNDKARSWSNIVGETLNAFTEVAVDAGINYAQGRIDRNRYEEQVRNRNELRNTAGRLATGAIAGGVGGFDAASSPNAFLSSVRDGFGFSDVRFTEDDSIAGGAGVALQDNRTAGGLTGAYGGLGLQPADAPESERELILQALGKVGVKLPGIKVTQLPIGDPADLDAEEAAGAIASFVAFRALLSSDVDGKKWVNTDAAVGIVEALARLRNVTTGSTLEGAFKSLSEEQIADLVKGSVFVSKAGNALLAPGKSEKSHDIYRVIQNVRIDVTPLVKLLDVAGELQDIETKSQIFVAAADRLQVFSDGDLAVDKDRKEDGVPIISRGDQVESLGAGIVRLLSKDSSKFLEFLSVREDTRNGRMLQNVIKGVIDAGNSNQLYPLIKNLRGEFYRSDTATNAGGEKVVANGGAIAAGYFVGALAGAIDSISSDRESKVQAVFSIFNISTNLLTGGAGYTAAITDPTAASVKSAVESYRKKDLLVFRALEAAIFPAMPVFGTNEYKLYLATVRDYKASAGYGELESRH